MFINLNTNETYDYEYISYRGMGYGRDDLGDRKQFFKWSDSLEHFLAVCGNHLNEFIDDCKNDPIDWLEGCGLKYVSDLGFPNAHDFAYQFPDEFCQLVLDYHLDTVLKRPLQKSPSPDNRNPKQVFGCFRPPITPDSTQIPP